jgi:tripartite-type tricarboxylate transporter receptor subunit TctC
MLMHRYIVIASMLTSAAGPAFSQSDAATYPNKPIRLIVALTAGGPTDLLARIISQPLGERLGKAVVVENRPGAGGNIGAEYVARADPDGYTLFLGTSGPLAINASLYTNLPFDPVKDFSPIVLAATAPFVVVVNPKLQAKTLPELTAYAKQNPGKLNFGAVPGNAAHLATELYKSMAAIDMKLIPYKGAGPATNDLLAGQIDMSFASTPGVVGFIKTGKLRALGVTSKERIAQLPDVPTLAESGLPGYEASVWYGVAAPAKTPPAIVIRLNTVLAEILKDKAVVKRMDFNNFDATTSTPQQFADFIKSETDKWGNVVKTSGAKLN